LKKLIIAIDLNDKNKIYELIDKIGDRVDIYKVGWIPYLVCGKEIIKKLKYANKKVFIDFKFFDIPNTVKNAIKILCDYGIDMFTFHLLSGEKVCKSIIELKKELKSEVKAIGVSILTSFTDEDIKKFGINIEIKKLVENLAKIGYECGIDGLVCSGEELKFLREKFPPPFLIIVPGIRVEKVDDQKRIMSAKEAIKKGADFIVVGRPIYESSEPIKVVDEILKEIEDEK
jgi:orotidine-5'-phosphate decarboxylase